MSAEGIAQIVAAAGRAAVPRKELLGFAEDAAKMGVAFDSTAEEAGTTMAKWRTAFELPQSGVVALADQINALTNSFGGDVGAVTDMVTRIGPLGKVGGLAASQIAAMSQVLSSVGVESEVGATGIKHDARAHQARRRPDRSAMPSNRWASMPGRSPRTCSATRAARSPM
jgi:TP901 family phage tail tape measure protein